MLNKWIGIGRLGADPELKRTQSDRSVTSFSLAVERDFAPKGEKRETDWVECVAWGTTAEFICKWFGKGRQMAVTGRLQVRSWEDKQGNKRRSTEVVVDNAYFADSKPFVALFCRMWGYDHFPYDPAVEYDVVIDTDTHLVYTPK